PSLAKTIVLVVDDDDLLRKTIAFDFKKKGYQVLEAPSGHAAFDLIQAKPIGLIVSDVRMPDGDGIELLDRVKENNKALPFIFVSGFADLTLEDAYDKGAAGMIAKPFERATLFATVEKS